MVYRKSGALSWQIIWAENLKEYIDTYATLHSILNVPCGT